MRWRKVAGAGVALGAALGLVVLLLPGSWPPPEVTGATTAPAPERFAPVMPATSLAAGSGATGDDGLRADCLVSSDETLAEPVDQAESEAARLAYLEELNRLGRRLAASPDPEQRHAAALLEREAARRIAVMQRALAAVEGDPFLTWTAVRICADVAEQVPCPLEEWESRLIRLDGQNSEVWIGVAARRWRAGDHAAALRALRSASSAAETRTYWPEMVALLERAMAFGAEPQWERAGNAFGVAAMNGPLYRTSIAMCRTQSVTGRHWADACLAYGQLLERQGRTLMDEAMGRAFQRIALEAIGDTERLADVDRRREAGRQAISIETVRRMEEALRDPVNFARYLESLHQVGEAETIRRLDTDPEFLRPATSQRACAPDR